jgi:hypothetical protein
MMENKDVMENKKEYGTAGLKIDDNRQIEAKSADLKTKDGFNSLDPADTSSDSPSDRSSSLEMQEEHAGEISFAGNETDDEMDKAKAAVMRSRRASFRLLAIGLIWYYVIATIAGLIRGDIPESDRTPMIIISIVMGIASIGLTYLSIKDFLETRQKNTK